MKRFFYEHAGLTAALICLALLLPICLIIMVSAVENETFAIIGGIGIAIFCVIILVMAKPTLAFTRGLDHLIDLKYERNYFFLNESLSCDEAEKRIHAYAEKKKFCRISIEEKGKDAPVAMYRKKGFASAKDPETFEEYSHTDLNYLLYRVERLDEETWEKIKADATRRMRDVRSKNQKNPKSILTVAALCVLADVVAPEVIKYARAPQKFTVADVHVCLAEPSKDRWYAYARTQSDDAALFSRATCSRRTLAKLTFGGRFPYRGNEEYTDAYWRALDEAVESSRSQKQEQNERKKAEQGNDEEELRFAEMAEGEIRRYGDEIYLVYHKYHVTTFLYLPNEVERIRAEIAEDEDKNETLQDILDDVEEQEPQRDEVPADYRGEIIVDVPTLAVEPRLKMFGKKDAKQMCIHIRDYLLAQGFARVLFWDSEKDTMEEIA